MKSENWIKWDLDSRSGLKMAAYFDEHRIAGYGFFMILIEQLYRAEENRLAKSSKGWQTLARLCRITNEEATNYINTLVDLELLEDDGDFIFSKRILAEMHDRGIRAEIRSAAGRIGGLAKAANAKQELASAKQTLANSTVSARGEEIRVDKIRSEESRSEKSEYIDARTRLDDVTREQALMTYGTRGLDASDLERSFSLIDRHYEMNPHKKAQKSDYVSGWVIEVLQKEKANVKRLEGGAGYKPHTGANTYETNLELAKGINLDEIRETDPFRVPTRAIDYQKELSGNRASLPDVVVSASRPKP